MDTPRFQRLKDVVAGALARPAGEREAFVRAQCADDAELRQEALSLLARDIAPAGAGVTADVAGRIGRAAAHAVGEEGRPETIGSYRILGILGEGGMGTVYRALQQEPLQREVALKVIRGGFGGTAAAARFTAESQALAVMNHPHIAHVFEVGSTESGRPWFAMELVTGLPVTAYCDEHRLRLPQRLELFEQVCHAVQHAHQRGIIHRDLKPSNVMVAEVDGVASPRIIDFGIAKAIADDPGSGGLRTEAGALLGTLEYMSPEQAAGDPAQVDTRSDIYSLGVLLYELVCGRLPFESGTLRAVAGLESVRILKEKDPPRPSLRLIANDPGTTTAAAARATEPGTLRRQVRGDLDWVVMKALEKDPNRRYQTAHELALDIARSRRDQPVTAGPPGLRYRSAKFVRRHRVGVVAASAVLVAILAGTTLAVTGLVRATREQKRAETEAATTRAINEFLSDMLVAVQPDNARGREVTVREILDAASTRLDQEERFAAAPEVAASLSFTIGDTYLELGEYDLALRFLERALEIRRRLLDSADERVIVTIDRIGRVHWEKGDLEESLRRCEEIRAIRERTVGRLHPEYAAVMGNLGNTYADLGRYAEAERCLREALAIDRQVLPDEQGADLALSLNNLATLLADQEKYAEAVELHRESLALRRRFHGEPSPAVLTALGNLGFAQTGLGEYEAAEQTLSDAAREAEAIYGAAHPQTALIWKNLGVALQKQGRFAEAEQLFRRSLEVFVTTAGARAWRAGAVRASLGALLAETNRYAEAETELLAAWDILAAALDGDSKAVRGVARSLAGLYRLRGDSSLAATWDQRALGESRQPLS
ncbi:MAG: serine/threonine protein kinase [bacterium]|nr:serine/threonine protein kinase [bacterium]